MRGRALLLAAPGLVALLAAVLTAPPAPASPRRSAVPIEKVPAWAREAAARPVPATGTDLVWLHVETLVEPLDTGVQTTRRVAAKVLRPSGLDAIGRWAIGYRKDDDLRSLRSWTLLPDGTALAPDPREDVVDSPYLSGISVFEDSRVRSIRAAGVAVGSVVVYEDRLVEVLDHGAASFHFGDAGRPTVLSRFTLSVPEGWNREAVRFRAEGIEYEETPNGFAMTGRDLAPLAREELRPPASELLPQAWARWWSPDGARGYRDWAAVARWYEDLTAPVMLSPGEAAELAAKLMPADSGGLLGSLGRAYDFAARAVRYVSIQIGIGGWKPHTPAEACRWRFGDCKDKTFLLRSLVEPWGVKTYPVLALTRDKGKVLPEVPTSGQFNHCIAAVVLPEGAAPDLWPVLEVEGVGRLLFLDPTVDRGSAWDLSSAMQGTLGLLVLPETGRLIPLPVQPPEAGSTRRSLAARMDSQGLLPEATLVQTWTGTQAAGVRSYYAGLSVADLRRDIARDLQERFPGAKILEHRLEGLDRWDEPVVETTRFAGARFGKRAGRLLILEPGRAAGPLFSVSLPPPPRRWPLEIGHPRLEIVEAEIVTPAGLRLEALPENLAVETPELRARAEWLEEPLEEGGRRIIFRREARLLLGEVAPDRYEAFREAYGRVRGEDRKGLVFIGD